MSNDSPNPDASLRHEDFTSLGERGQDPSPVGMGPHQGPAGPDLPLETRTVIWEDATFRIDWCSWAGILASQFGIEAIQAETPA